MARPQKLNAEWFTHKGDLRNDRRVKAIRTATGMAGYGVLHCLLETLTDADNTTILVDEFELELLAGDFGVDAIQVSAVLEVGKKVGWFAIDSAQMLTCPELNKWLEMHFDKRNRSRNPRSGDSLSQPVTETPIPVTETPHSTLHNSTVQDITTTSSFQSEVDAASAAALAAVEVEGEKPLPESPQPELRTPGGAADVGTRKRGKAKIAPALLTGDLALLLNPGGVADRVQQMKQPLTQFEADALVTKYGTAAAQQIVKEMANYAKLTSNNVSANLTAQKWLDKRQAGQTHPITTPVFGAGRQHHQGVVHPGSVQGRLDTVAQARAELLGQPIG